MKSVFMAPHPNTARLNDAAGIPQVILRLEKLLPAHGWQIVKDEAQADISAIHAGAVETMADVVHCHGLYPTGEPGYPVSKWHHEINRRLARQIVGALEVTVPSEWVADILRRDFHVKPHVVSWAVNADEWHGSPAETHYVLWNKNRTEGVCTPEWLNRLAADLPHIHFLSTFGETLPNVRVTGVVPHENMQRIIEGAWLYLATTKETGDIGSMEALAAGVPVVGFRHGVLPDIVEHGVNGFLATPDDYDNLRDGVAWAFANRERLATKTRDAVSFRTWDNVASEFSKIYEYALEKKKREQNPTFAIVIPVHNYENFVMDALHAATRQEFEYPYQIHVVDDASEDNSVKAVYDWIVSQENGRADNVIVHEMEANIGVGNARNVGIEASGADYIVCLDADDMIHPAFMQTAWDTLKQSRDVGMAYTKMLTLKTGTQPQVPAWPGKMDYRRHYKGGNQVPTCCMFRREAWRRAGGYRQRYHPAEDADLWLRMCLVGYRAELASQEPMFHYRIHAASASAVYRSGNVPIPNYAAAKGRIRKDVMTAAAMTGDPEKRAFPVFNYDVPEITYIIPVCAKHVPHLRLALDSIEAQTHVNWTCIVVLDGSDAVDNFYSSFGELATAFAWAKLIPLDGPAQGAGYARNRGIEHADSEFVVFLDADDMLHPEFAEKAIAEYRRHGCYVYTGWYAVENRKMEARNSIDFDTEYLFRRGMFHLITALYPLKDVIAVGGFDETLPAWEDWDFLYKYVIAGHEGRRISEPLFYYRMDEGVRRKNGLQSADTLKQVLYERYKGYIEGEVVANCGCGTDTKKALTAAEKGELIKVSFRDPLGGRATLSVKGKSTRTDYGRVKPGNELFIYEADMKAEPQRFIPVMEEHTARMPAPIPGA